MTEPVLVRWGPPKWKPPVVDCACPSCGRQEEREATYWSANLKGVLKVRTTCEPITRRALDCFRVFDLVLVLEDEEVLARYWPP